MKGLPAFSLPDAQGRTHVFPGRRPALVAFVKEDCPTCVLTAPALGAIAGSASAEIDVRIVIQDEAGPGAFASRLPAGLPSLDDSRLGVSYAWEIETVPTIVLAGPGGAELLRLVGFDRGDWIAFSEEVARLAGKAPATIDWSSLPDFRPGCGSRSVEPGVAERLAAEAAGSPLRARRIEIGEADDIYEFLFDQGLTDGLPVIPPTPERVLRMLSGTRRNPQHVIGAVAPNYAPLTVEKAAINAVMAGCRPDYLPVVIAALEALTSEPFNLHGVLATTHFPTPVIIVNGPIRQRIGMNMRMNVLGQGNRANATIGRAVQLTVRNVGGGRPGEVDRAALGQPGKYTFCFPEFEERSRWEPLHVERGYGRDESTVTVFAGGAPTGIVDQLSRDGRSLATSYGLALASVSHPKQYNYGEIVLIVPPEHVETFARGGWTKEMVREQIQRASERPVRELVQDDACAEGLPRALADRLGLDTRLPKFRDPSSIYLVVAGGEAGKFAAYLQGWVSGPVGSLMTTVKVDP